MKAGKQRRSADRYEFVTDEKAAGATYTPTALADFVARQIVRAMRPPARDSRLRLLDPAVGDGRLLMSLLAELGKDNQDCNVEVYGFETDEAALASADAHLRKAFPKVPLQLVHGSFLNYVLERFDTTPQLSLFPPDTPETYDLIIANPPYVRTQILGAKQAQHLAQQFGLSGRVDLYYAFILGIGEVLNRDGVAGIIVSNRFMSTKSGAAVRKAIRERFNIKHVWDLGDTKLFDVAVLPAVLLLGGISQDKPVTAGFTSIYETTEQFEFEAPDPIAALDFDGVVAVDGDRRFRVCTGTLDGAADEVWRVRTESTDAWLREVDARTWGTFRDIGKVRVGVKTCADKVFIRSDWDTIPPETRPELLRPVATHHIARRFKAAQADHGRHILYPHEVIEGRRRAVNLDRYPNTKAYLEQHRERLENRTYVIDAGRQWYEIWVPQNPLVWKLPKLVFRDIARKPVFWIDEEGSIVNGDCYWIVCDESSNVDLLWLAVAVGNSTFIEAFYDHRFRNKLYAGRRRFITQYVERFPLPDPDGEIGQAIIRAAKAIYAAAGTKNTDSLADELDCLVWESFGLDGLA